MIDMVSPSSWFMPSLFGEGCPTGGFRILAGQPSSTMHSNERNTEEMKRRIMASKSRAILFKKMSAGL